MVPVGAVPSVWMAAAGWAGVLLGGPAGAAETGRVPLHSADGKTEVA